ncbi:heavy metal translocating P-type ATPase [uncultured Roseobacter sp.]|uniref:heavy metal translocating P-type ATPase n=1 Tax=uncultured Roseobacter sp. TaxID=114847 RepID=UPI002608D1EF|nr:heavy metal translocating P-type ATPase [uncultured Roseobacter sp.]
MSALSTNSPAACPGCLAGPPEPVAAPSGDARLMLSLPTIHCQACIAKVEAALDAHPGIKSARVNLTLKRALIDAEPEVKAAELVTVLETEGFEAHELDPGALNDTATRNASKDLLMRLAVAGFASMNVMLLSVAVWSGAADATRDLFHWISAAIALPAISFSAQPFFRNAWSALRAGRLNMDVPISLAIVLALVTSLWETWLSGHHAYFDAALTLTFFLLAGRWLDARARSAARSAAEELTALEVPRALHMTADGPVEVPVADLRIDDHVLIRPGARAPVDGIIIDGRSEIDRAMLTGETLPEVRGVGDPISAGEVNLTGPLTLQATAVGQETSLHRMAALVAVAESGRSRYTSLADRAAKLYAPGVHILSALAFLGWLIWSGDMRVSLNIAAAVLIITCPCALGLAVPAVTTAASGRLFGKGLLIKNATALERLAEADTVVFDKTGTLTTGKPKIVNWEQLTNAQKSVAFALAEGSAHPLSRAIAAMARTENQAPADVTEIVEKPGFGTQALLGNQAVRLGRPDWIGVTPPDDSICAALDMGDGTPVLLTFTDAPRQGAAEAIAGLRAQGVDVILLSGDRAPAVASFAAGLEIEDWHAAMLPDAKARFVGKLRDEGRHVLMVGDGLNDTAALATAHVSISPAQALDAARAASDMVLLGQDLEPIADAVAVARQATRRIRENFQIATLYNIVAVPLAVAGLATPLIAALAMSTSSITVSLNALRVRGRG